MQKKYKNYEIKSTTHNKRWKLYKDDEELFVAPSLSDIMAYIQIEERGVWQDKYQLLGGNWEYENEPVALLTHPETGEQTVAPVAQPPLADDTGFKPKPIVKKKTSMKMKKK